MSMLETVRTWGSTAEERARDYPCDRWLENPDDTCFRAIDVAAPPEVAFRWLCQLRAAPYSYDWVDNGGRRSPRTLTPGLDELADRQRVMRIFRLVEHERDHHPIRRSTSVSPPSSSRPRLNIATAWPRVRAVSMRCRPTKTVPPRTRRFMRTSRVEWTMFAECVKRLTIALRA